MRVLVVGSGGREAALAWKIAQSPLLTQLYVQGRRPGLPEGVEVLAGDVVEGAVAHGLDLVVVGPEAPLAAGLADRLRAAGIAVFGPSQAAAQLESSKGWSKDFMRRHGIPTADYGCFTTAQSAHEFVRGACVVKADGLAAGKGVFVCDTAEQAHDAIDRLLADGGAVVVEERLTGPELSVMALCDGERFVLLPSSRDHKRRFDADQGPNTGGMGAFSPVPGTEAVVEQVGREVIGPALAGMAAEGHPFVGCLYAGMMLTPDGPKTLEFNVRFGDPECQVLMTMVAEDLLPRLHQAAVGDLDPRPLELADGAACVVVGVSDGYPGSYPEGRPITLPPPQDGVVVFHAGTRFGEGDVVETSGGRVLGLTARADTLDQAISAAYTAVSRTHFEGMGHRTDIGRSPEGEEMPQVGILMGSANDRPVMEGATSVLDELGITWEMRVRSAHRTPHQSLEYARTAESRGIKVLICGAGMAAHLAGVMAAESELPVIGVPIGASMMGLDALLATVQMPPGVPVATVAVGKAGAKNAAWMAARIMALSDASVKASLTAARAAMTEKVLAADEAMQAELQG